MAYSGPSAAEWDRLDQERERVRQAVIAVLSHWEWSTGATPSAIHFRYLSSDGVTPTVEPTYIWLGFHEGSPDFYDVEAPTDLVEELRPFFADILAYCDDWDDRYPAIYLTE